MKPADVLRVPPGGLVGDALRDVAAWLAAGKVGIVPTDTLYGLSGDARRADVVERINAIKVRARPATIIPHDLDWARALIAERLRSTFHELWNRYRGDTMLLPYAPEPGVTPLPEALVSSGLVSLRGPRHWSFDLAQAAGVPLVTTSANVTGQPPMTGEQDVAPEVLGAVDFFLVEGVLRGPASALVHFEEDPPRREVRS